MQEIEGFGDSVLTGGLAPGLALFQFEHEGDRNFSVWLRGETTDELLVNTIGDYSGTTVASTEGGEIVIEITADGPWRLSLHNPVNTQPILGTLSHEATGDNVTPFLSLADGLHLFAFTHSGDSNFVVWLYDQFGNRIDLLVNEIGNYSGMVTARVEQGAYIFAVEADGFWTFSLRY